MATMLVKMKVGEYNQWKRAFDELDQARRAHGWISYDILRDDSDPNSITVISKMKDIEQGKAYGRSPELRDAIQRAGVIGAPDIQFFSDVEQKNF
jgi:quinol monooxygenase YgiN